jgi:hypothetical protein
MKPTSCHPVVDLALGQTELEQLPSSHHPVLPRS